MIGKIFYTNEETRALRFLIISILIVISGIFIGALRLMWWVFGLGALL